MPLFEYRCDQCGRKFSLLVGVTAEKAKLRCPKCGATRATKLISRIARTPKGDDFDDDLGGFGGEGADLDEGMDDDLGDEDLDEE
jgi:putative FmdB family regulatory protein